MNSRNLTITLMRRGDINACAELSVQAFAEYEYFTNYFADREERLAFMRAMIRSEYRTTRRRAHFLVGRNDGVPVAVADFSLRIGRNHRTCNICCTDGGMCCDCRNRTS